MKTHRTTYSLLVVFFAGLLVLWGLEYYGVRTDKEIQARGSLILPDLRETAPSGVRRLSIERGKERLVFERREGGGQWQMVEPMNVAAEPSRLETLVRNLKELPRSLDAGSMTGSPATFGLDQPEAIVRVWGEQKDGTGATDAPLAILEIGKTVKRLRYVRPAGDTSIEVADAKLLSAVDQPVLEWRERAVVPVATFQVESVSIKRGESQIRVNRTRNGRFKLVEPFAAPADAPKVESLLAAISSLRVSDGAKGFVANDVGDFSPFGLSPPSATIEVRTARYKENPLVLEIGKPVPDHPDRIYVRRADQDDVVSVNAQPLSELPRSAAGLRSQKVADFEPVAVSQIKIKSPVQNFLLKKESNDWVQKEPKEEKADSLTVATLLKHLEGMQTSEFLDPSKVRDPQLKPPLVTIQLTETRVGRAAASASIDEVVLDLQVGRYDQARKVCFARLANDESILAIPDTILQVLPKTAMEFRDKAVITASAANVKKLIITRAGRTDELVPEPSGEPNRWRMHRPIDAPADSRSITQILALLQPAREQLHHRHAKRRDQVRARPSSARGRVGNGPDAPAESRLAGSARAGLLRRHSGRAGCVHAERRDLEAVRGRVSRSRRHEVCGRRCSPNGPLVVEAAAHRVAQAPAANRQGATRVGRRAGDGYTRSRPLRRSCAGQSACASGDYSILTVRRRDRAIHRAGASPAHRHGQAG